MASEVPLTIVARAKDLASKTLSQIGPKAKKSFEEVADASGDASEKTKKSIDSVGSVVSGLATKVGLLAAAFGGLLVGNFLARLGGYNSLMEAAIDKMDRAQDAAARWVGKLAGVDMDEALRKVESLDDVLKRVRENLLEKKEPLNVLGVILSTKGLDDSQIDLLGKRLEVVREEFEAFEKSRAVQIFGFTIVRDSSVDKARVEAQEKLRRVEAEYRLELAKTNQFEAESVRLAKKMAKADEAWAERLELGRKAMAAKRAETDLYNGAVRKLMLSMEEMVGRGLDIAVGQLDRRANERARIDRLTDEMERRIALTREQLKLEADEKRSAADLAAAYQSARNQALQAAAASKRAAEDGKKFGLGWKEGIQDAIDALGTLRDQGRYLAAEFAFETFDGFRQFFNDVISGSQKAGDAFKAFAKNIVLDLTDVFAQILARKLTLQIFGSGVLPFLKDGGVVQGNMLGHLPLKKYKDGGVANSPQLALFGEGSGAEAFVPLKNGRIPVEQNGAGMQVEFVLNVGSLDPRTAADVILGNMQKIEDAIASAISTGRNRGLRAAVQGRG